MGFGDIPKFSDFPEQWKSGWIAMTYQPGLAIDLSGQDELSPGGDETDGKGEEKTV